MEKVIVNKIILHMEGLRFKDKGVSTQAYKNTATLLDFYGPINMNACISIRIVVILLSTFLFHSYWIATR